MSHSHVRSDYKLVELPGYNPSMKEIRISLPEASKQQQADVKTRIFHALWHELHTDIRTKEQFANWVKCVPAIGCECSSWLAKYLKDNPPAEDLREYGWTLHNAVNRKLERTEFTWAEFCERYPQVPSE